MLSASCTISAPVEEKRKKERSHFAGHLGQSVSPLQRDYLPLCALCSLDGHHQPGAPNTNAAEQHIRVGRDTERDTFHSFFFLFRKERVWWCVNKTSKEGPVTNTSSWRHRHSLVLQGRVLPLPGTHTDCSQACSSFRAAPERCWQHQSFSAHSHICLNISAASYTRIPLGWAPLPSRWLAPSNVGKDMLLFIIEGKNT